MQGFPATTGCWEAPIFLITLDVAIVYPSPAGISGQQAARMVLTEMPNEQTWGIRARLGATYGAYAP